MPLKLPKNQIVKSKYTAGDEFIFVSTQNKYQGYYYETNGKFYAGKEFQANNPEIIKVKSDKFNNLLGSVSTFLYGALSNVKIPTQKISSQPTSNIDNMIDKGGEFFLKFYCKNIIDNIIKEIDEQTYINLQKNSLYQTTYIGNYNNITQIPDEAEKQLPGIKLFLGL